MPGWFDIYNLGDINGRQDEDGMKESVKTVHKLIKEEIDSGISSERIIVGGFSQGNVLWIFMLIRRMRNCYACRILV